MSKKLRTGLYGSVTSIGWEAHEGNKSKDIFAVFQVKLENVYHADNDTMIKRAESRIEEYKKLLLGEKVQVFTV